MHERLQYKLHYFEYCKYHNIFSWFKNKIQQNVASDTLQIRGRIDEILTVGLT